MIDIEKPAVKSVQEPVDEKQEKELANPENISGKVEFGPRAISTVCSRYEGGREPSDGRPVVEGNVDNPEDDLWLGPPGAGSNTARFPEPCLAGAALSRLTCRPVRPDRPGSAKV
ncbi:MAG: hypothetical protein ACE5HT_17245 [Gemmatimonadales bacterium]